MIITKRVSTNIAAVGDCVTYTITVCNEGPYSIDDIVISDTLAPELKFVEGSLRFNGKVSMGDVISGIKIGSLLPRSKQIDVIEFDVLILCPTKDKIVTNITSGTYSYSDPLSGKKQFGCKKSDPCYLTVFVPRLEIIKEQDKECARLCDTVYYALTLYNTGDMDLVNVLVKDKLSPVLEIIPGSITLDGQVIHIENLEQGINIPLIETGGRRQICFAVVVCGGTSEETLCNVATAMATYVLPDCTMGTRGFASNSVPLIIGMQCFKEVLLEKHLLIPPGKENVEEIDEVVANTEILEQYVIETPTGTSCEGQILTGRKLVINGVTRVDISYITGNITQSVHFIHYDLPFSTFMILPLDYKDKAIVGVVGEVQNIHYRVNSCRSFYMTIALLLEGKVLK